MKKIFLLLVACMPVLHTLAQQQAHRDTVLLSGIVFDADSTRPLSNVTIIRHHRQGTVSDKNGYFEIYSTAGDTLLFSFLGFKEVKLIIPAKTANKEYYTSVSLSRSAVSLKEIEVFPWPKENFRQDFLNANVQDKNLDNAKRNLNIANYEALSMKQTSAWSNDQVQKYYQDQFAYHIANKDRRNALEAGAITPVTQVVNTNTIFGLIILARQLKRGELKQGSYKDMKQQENK